MIYSIKKAQNVFFQFFCIVFLAFSFLQCTPSDPDVLELQPDDSIVLIGNNLGSRMMYFGHFETELHVRYPEHSLLIRNQSIPGDTPGFRPHSSRDTPWAFPDAGQFHNDYATPSGSEGHFPTPDEWISKFNPNVLIAFFGYNESFRGPDGVETFQDELDAFIGHSLAQPYNEQGGHTDLVLVSPIAFEDLSGRYDLPDGVRENENLELYTEAMREVAARHEVRFVDVFTPTRQWYEDSDEPLTIDGSQLTDAGYERFGALLADAIFGNAPARASEHRELIHAAVQDKNWMWHQDYKIPNGVHAYGRRFEPFGPDNYPAEIEKTRQMTDIRDRAIWQAAARGQAMDVAAADEEQTIELPPVESNFDPERHGNPEYLYGQDALDRLTVPDGYRIELFASEEDFPELANPVQLSFDTRGRLWVATLPSYPHYKPGDTRPDDKLIILEDTSGDGRADQVTTFADGLHLPLGFAFAPEGVYVSQGPNLVLLRDTTGDDKADSKEILLSGFDDHDTHHAHSAYTMDPSGAIYMAEGVFLHTNVETSRGPVRATNGGFYRYAPQRGHLERTAQLSIPNPWGIAFDEWGQQIFAVTSGPDVHWMMPGTIKPRYGVASPNSRNLIEPDHRVRPTSGLEFVSSRHFPDHVQGDFLINNTIGFLGTKQHTLDDEGTGYASAHRQDLVVGTDPNFRPVDMEFAPDGSLYLVDWHNVLIGHMQHNARDPLRDHVHGRIYRITYPERPLLEPARVHDASIEELFENLRLPELRTRERTRLELRGREAGQVLSTMQTWVDNLDQAGERYEHHLLEALWVSWGLNRVDQDLLRRLLNADDYRARAAAVRVLRYTGHQVDDQPELLVQAAGDPHGRVRLEAIVAASWLEIDQGMAVLNEAAGHPLDDWMDQTYQAAMAHLVGEPPADLAEEEVDVELADDELELYLQGREIYGRDGYCGTCHGADGQGLTAAGFPPLAGTRWVTGSQERLIKLTLHGLAGPMEVLGREYPGSVPMTPFRGLLDDEQTAAVLTYVRNAFGNQAPAVTEGQVRRVREATSGRTAFYSPQELLEEHPLEE
jgi:mono/diheme cytochrome c family protein/glucose/arabinose dehydrogenase